MMTVRKSIKIPQIYTSFIDELVNRGIYKSKSDFVNKALANVLNNELKLFNKLSRFYNREEKEIIGLSLDPIHYNKLVILSDEDNNIPYLKMPEIIRYAIKEQLRKRLLRVKKPKQQKVDNIIEELPTIINDGNFIALKIISDGETKYKIQRIKGKA